VEDNNGNMILINEDLDDQPEAVAALADSSEK
jgi:hypothetical protein